MAGRPAAGKQQDTDQIAGRIPWQLLEDGFDLFGSQIVIARCLLVAFDTDRRVAIRPAPFDSKIEKPPQCLDRAVGLVGCLDAPV
jgi:hypothetical protein